MRKHERQAIEELARLLDGDVRLDDVSPAVRELGGLATKVRQEIHVPAAPPEFKAALRERLVTELPATDITWLDRLRDSVWDATGPWRHNLSIVVASGATAAAVATAGVGVAAQEALPHELLYPVKQVTEDVRMGLAGGAEETGRLHLEFARERLDEAVASLDVLDTDRLIDLLAEMDEHTLAAVEDLLRAYQQTGDDLLLLTLERFAEAQREGLSTIFAALPGEVRPFVDRSFDLLQRIEVHLAAIADGGCVACAEALGIDISASGDGTLGSAGCDCVAPLPPSSVRDTLPTEVPVAVDTELPDDSVEGGTDGGDDADGGGTLQLPGDTTTSVPTLPGPLEGIGETLQDAVDELSGDEDGTDTTDPVDEVTEPVEDTTDTVGDTVDDTTGTLDDTTDTVTDTTDETTDSVDGTLDDATGTVDDTTGTVDDTTGGGDDTSGGGVDELLPDTSLP